MSTGQFFATRFCAFRFATFFHKIAPQKTAGYMGVRSQNPMNDPEYTFSFKLKPKEPLSVFVLEVGGYSLPCFINASILLLDRNVLSNIRNILSKGNHRDNVANSWWFSFLNSPSISLNPALSAMEGRNQKTPTYDEFCTEFDRDRITLEEFFPETQTLKYSDIHYRAAYELVEAGVAGYKDDLNFLLEAIPLITNRNPAHKLRDIESRLFEVAKSNNIKKLAFPLIACLSCLYESSTSTLKSNGRSILKPKPNYTSSMAHNALMDLSSLSMLLQANSKLNSKIGLCTSDKGLVKFWCDLQTNTHGKSTSSGFEVTLELTTNMFQLLNKQGVLDLKSRIEAYNF